MKQTPIGKTIRKLLVLLYLTGGALTVQAQKDTSGSAVFNNAADYDELFDALEDFLDSLTRPRSFTLVNVGAGTRIVNYASGGEVRDRKLWLLTPSLGYFNKNGLGVNASVAVLKESTLFNPYQLTATASYDYQKSFRFLTGVSYARYFSRDSLQFYTSPLQNDVYAYFTYRKSWLRPMLSVRYGWGSRSEVEERNFFYQQNLDKKARNKYKKELKEWERKKKKRNGRGEVPPRPVPPSPVVHQDSVVVNTTESIADLSLILSVRHDFYWRELWGTNNYVRLTPQLSVNGGTRKFGFNQNAAVYSGTSKSALDLQYSAQEQMLAQSKFQPLSVTAFLKTEFVKGKFFLQPQLIADYYFPAADNRLTTAFVVNTGFLF